MIYPLPPNPCLMTRPLFGGFPYVALLFQYPPNIWSSSGRTPQYPFSVQFGDTGYSSSASSNRPSSESSASPDNADPFTPNPHFSPNTMVPHYDTRLNSGPENTRPFHYGSGRAGMMAAPRQPYLDTLTSTGGGVLTPGDASLPMPWNSHHPIAQVCRLVLKDGCVSIE